MTRYARWRRADRDQCISTCVRRGLAREKWQWTLDRVRSPHTAGFHDVPSPLNACDALSRPIFLLSGTTMSISLTGAAPFLSLDDPDTGPGELPKLPHISQATFVGILVAISGNVVISLALNCQKLAHKRLEREREQEQELQSQSPTTPGDNDSLATHHAQPIRSPRHTVTILETEPLLDVPDSPASSTYGTDSPPHTTHARPRKKRHVLSRLFLRKDDDHPYRDADASHLAVTHALLPVEVVPTRRDVPPKADKRDASEGDYLKSKLWYVRRMSMAL